MQKLFTERHGSTKPCVAEKRAAMNPVSYTHLDVYKRQVDPSGGVFRVSGRALENSHAPRSLVVKPAEYVFGLSLIHI